MATRLNPYISFKDNARDAMEFYKDVFGGTLNVSTFGEFGQPDSPDADKIMHAQLETDSGYTLMGSDTPQGMEYNPDELRGYWTKLSEGGTVSMPLEKQMWGDEFGSCTDKFGIGWMVNIAGDSSPGAS